MNPLVKYRLIHGLNQGELSGYLGIPRPTLCAYETGERKPSVSRALMIESKTKGEIRREDLRPDIYLPHFNDTGALAGATGNQKEP